MKLNNAVQISFGNSKESQEWLDKKIKKTSNKTMAGALQTTSDFCNKTEDIIRKRENKGKNNANTRTLIDMLISAKGALYGAIIDMFDDCDDYTELEYEYYTDSFEKCNKKSKNDWRFKLMDMYGFTDNLQFDFDDKTETKTETKTEQKMDTEKKELIINDIKSIIASNSNVEKLQRTSYSPNGFEDIMGMDELKQRLITDIVNPINNPMQAELDFQEYGKKSPSCIMLYGPPGCGKTYIVEALANEIGTDVYMIDSSITGSKYINQTSNNIKNAFDAVASIAKNQEKPVFIFMDEIDAMTSNRKNAEHNEDNKTVATLLKCIEGAKANNIIVFGATNRFDMIDPAIRRRFDFKYYVGLPDEEERMAQLEYKLQSKSKGQKLVEDKDALREVSKMLNGYSYNSINIVSDDAALNALNRGRDDIKPIDYKTAIEKSEEDKVNEDNYKRAKNQKTKPIGFSSEVC